MTSTRSSQGQTKKAATLPLAPESSVIAWLKTNDLSLYCSKATFKSARRQFSADTGTRFYAKRFANLAKEHCEWFKNRFRRPVRIKSALNEKQWSRVKSAVISLLHVLHGQTLQVAVEIVRSEISVNETILSGLPKRLRVWERPRLDDID